MAAKNSQIEYPDLRKAAFTFPAIDNHAHPLLRQAHRDIFPFENLISEAEGKALTENAQYTLAYLRAAKELAPLLGLGGDASWDEIKRGRGELEYTDLCKLFMGPAGIQSILVDDGLGGSQEFAESIEWHDQFTRSPTKRIVRVEIIAQELLQELLKPHISSVSLDTEKILDTFCKELEEQLSNSARDPIVVGFKSVVCYRTGLNISVDKSLDKLKSSLLEVFELYKAEGKIKLASKALNDEVVRCALRVGGRYGKPVQFHTGLGDNDITLSLSSPAHMQSIIKAFPETKFVLLHSSYPYTRDAGYLTAVYHNVYLDFGEIFPFVSRQGQESVIRQVLELTPTNKIMWSTDGHWWPESYYLGAFQARQALYVVLKECVNAGDLTEKQAIGIIENALFHNANRIYDLKLTPHVPSG